MLPAGLDFSARIFGNAARPNANVLCVASFFTGNPQNIEHFALRLFRALIARQSDQNLQPRGRRMLLIDGRVVSNFIVQAVLGSDPCIRTTAEMATPDPRTPLEALKSRGPGPTSDLDYGVIESRSSGDRRTPQRKAPARISITIASHRFLGQPMVQT